MKCRQCEDDNEDELRKHLKVEKNIGIKVNVKSTSRELIDNAYYTVLHSDVTDKTGLWNTTIGGKVLSFSSNKFFFQK